MLLAFGVEGFGLLGLRVWHGVAGLTEGSLAGNFVKIVEAGGAVAGLEADPPPAAKDDKGKTWGAAV
jgi:hypothetical protein